MYTKSDRLLWVGALAVGVPAVFCTAGAWAQDRSGSEEGAMADSFDETQEEPWSFEAQPLCYASTSISGVAIVDIVEALLVPVPEEALP